LLQNEKYNILTDNLIAFLAEALFRL
jgi:hypothetical protein